MTLFNPIGINNDYNFGIEIEFMGTDLDLVQQKISELYNKKILKIRNDSASYKKWNAIEDKSVTINIDSDNSKYGGEVVSPILDDSYESWSEVYNICNELKKLNASGDYKCGGHIHISSDILENNPKYLYNLLLLWVNYEDVIFKFGYNGLGERDGIEKYASSMYNTFFKQKDSLKNNNIHEIISNNNFDKYDALNFKNFINSYPDNDYKNTIEVRSPNGTIDYDVWKNNVRFFFRLFEYAKNNDFDIDKFEFNISDSFKSNLDLYKKYDQLNVDKALELANLIYDEVLEKDDFMKQYTKTKRKKCVVLDF